LQKTDDRGQKNLTSDFCFLTSGRIMKKYNVAVIGVGAVGAEILRILKTKKLSN